MLTADQIEALRDRAAQLTEPVTEFLIADIAQRIAEAGQLTSTAQYQIWRAQNLGLSQRKIKKRLQELLKKTNAEIEELLTQSAEVGYRYDLNRLPTAVAIPFEENAVLQQIVQAAVALAQEDFSNITQTLGMVDPHGHALPLQDAYRSACDFAFKQVSTGAADYNTAIRQAVQHLAAKGVRTIDYESGVHTSLEAAVRRNVMGGLGLMQAQISKQNHDDLGCDGWEISAHSASAPDHEPIQGRQYSDDEYENLNNSLVRRIGTLNCGHAAFPIILGINSPQYTPEELEKMRQDNEKGIDYNGRHYTMYEATQRQRRLESKIRKQKREILIDEITGDREKLQTGQIRYQMLNQEYKRFSQAAGLRVQHERLEVSGFGPKQARAARTAYSEKRVEISQNHATIGSREKDGEGTEVRYITQLDAEKYKCVSEGIVTNEVVITDERIKHIRDRHPNDFERYELYIKKIIENPDYILEANKPNTAFLLKEIQDADERFQLILRLAVAGDPEGYKNSVITFLRIEKNGMTCYLRTKKVLYKSE